jgi:hypothetical protein
MKNLKLLGMAAFVLPLLFSVALTTLTGCPEPDKKPAQMTFQGPNAQLTINSNFEFEVVFTRQVDVQPPILFFSKNNRASGTYTDRDPPKAKWNEDFAGTAVIKSVTTDNATLTTMGKIPLPVSLEYKKNNGAIIGLELTITDANPMINEIGNSMMGGTYTLIKK